MIFLWIFLGLLALILIFLFTDLALRVDYDEDFRFTLFVFGIPFPANRLVRWFLNRENGVMSIERNLKRPKEQRKQNPSEKKSRKAKLKEILETAEDLYSYLCALGRALRSLWQDLSRHLKIRVRYLDLTLGTGDAAETALTYGRVNAILESVFALFSEHFNFAFRAKRMHIRPDFEHEKLSATFGLTLFMKPFFLILTDVRMTLAFLEELLEDPEAFYETKKPKTRKDPEK